MRNNTIVTSTNSIEGAIIEKYIDVISTNVVVGTNFFSDFGASITDIFGGLSDTYQIKLQKIYKIGIDKLKVKARNIDANAIIGLKVDFDEVSGKGKSMFMISVVGTAVRIKKHETLLNKDLNFIIESDELEIEVEKEIIITKVNSNTHLSKEDWNFLLNYPIVEISSKILDIYINQLINPELSNESIRENTAKYFTLLEEDYSTKILYQSLLTNPNSTLRVIRISNLFSPEKLYNIINEIHLDTLVSCINVGKKHYSKNDLDYMEKIELYLDNLENLGKIEMTKSVLGKTKEKYICPDGHSNNAEIEYCSNESCYKNIKGISIKQNQIINKYKLRIKSLKKMMLS